MSEINVISVEQLKSQIEISSDALLILDMRDRRFYRIGHIDGALHLGDHNLRTLLKNVNKNIKVVIYCYHGVASMDMTKMFVDFGFLNCYSLEGGFEAWSAQEKKQLSSSQALQDWLIENNYHQDYLDERGFNGETALLTAAKNGNTSFVVELLDLGADPNALNDDGNSSVWFACYSNQSSTLKVLIQEGAVLDIQNDNGATPLIYVASKGHYQMVKLLVESGADLNLQTQDGFNALDVAATPSILKYLKGKMNEQAQISSSMLYSVAV